MYGAKDVRESPCPCVAGSSARDLGVSDLYLEGELLLIADERQERVVALSSFEEAAAHIAPDVRFSQLHGVKLPE